jgi:DNA-binding response OmpR family regulator
MQPVKILVVEDDPFVSMDIEAIVGDLMPAVVTVTPSVAAAEKVLEEPLDLALLDVDVLDGKSFPIAERLRQRATPFIFVSGSLPDDLPRGLRTAPFLAKPYQVSDVAAAIRASLGLDGRSGA